MTPLIPENPDPATLGKPEAATANTGEGQMALQINSDGFCDRCSEWVRPFKLMLEKVGIPTGAKDWPATWGVAKIEQLRDDHDCLSRLILALDGGDYEKIAFAVRDAKHRRELHAIRYRAMVAEHQRQADLSENAPSSDNAAGVSSLREALTHLEVIATADVSDMESRNHNASPMKRRAMQALELLKQFLSAPSNEEQGEGPGYSVHRGDCPYERTEEHAHANDF